MEEGGGEFKQQKAMIRDRVKKGTAAVGEDVESDEEEKNTGGGGGNGKKGSNCSGGGGGSMGRNCQAERCTADLSDAAKAKQYHRRHKVCEHHAKAPVVVVAGIRQRFCQQCSRFHELSEFDDSKRSCRRRLAGHNERRRKNTADSPGERSSRKGTGGGTQLKEIVCGGQVDDRGMIQVSVGQENGNGSHNKHFHIRSN